MRWAPVPGFPRYRVSDEGYVESRKKNDVEPFTWKRLKPGRNRAGYLSVCLRKNGNGYFRLVHCLVLEAFVGPRPHGMQACHHPDPTPSNNCLENLRWDTPRGNHSDAIALGRHAHGERTNTSKLTVNHVRIIKSLVMMGSTDGDIASACNVSRTTINGIRNERTWSEVEWPDEPVGSLEDLAAIPLLEGVKYTGVCLIKQNSSRSISVRFKNDYLRALEMICEATGQTDYTYVVRGAIRYAHARICANSMWKCEFPGLVLPSMCCTLVPNWPYRLPDAAPVRLMTFSLSKEYLDALDQITRMSHHVSRIRVLHCAIRNEFLRVVGSTT